MVLVVGVRFVAVCHFGVEPSTNDVQGSYTSGKCQGNFDFFKVRELSGNFMLCQGKMNVC